MTDKKALEVLESWLRLAYQNADGTDKDSAELYEALQTMFNLINRLKAELDESREKNAGLALALLHEVVNEDEQLRNEITKVAVSEAYKEFANKLLRKATFMRDEETINGVVRVGDIYKTLEEMGCE